MAGPNSADASWGQSASIQQRADALRRNRQAWDQMAETGHVLCKPVADAELLNPLKTVDPAGWLSDGIQGWNVLCLAAGGGRHGPLYAAAGANVTVVDLSPGMLELDRQVAAERKLAVRTCETSMDDMPMLESAEFDLVIHPVSTCYLPSVEKLFPEIARVTRPGGLYISQHKQPANLQASLQTYTGNYVFEHAYYDNSPVPVAREPSKLREPNTREFAHSLQSLLGGMCSAGFAIESLIEPYHAKPDAPVGSFHHRCRYIAPYMRVKARKAAQPVSQLLLK